MEELTFKLGEWVLHRASGVYGTVTTIYAPGEYRDANDKPVHAVVVQLHTRDCFLAYADGELAFIPLTDREATEYTLALRYMQFAAGSVAKVFLNSGMDRTKAEMLWNAVLGQCMKAGLP